MIRKISLAALTLLIVLTAVFFAGPRVDLSHRPRAVTLPSDLEAYLQASEAKVPHLMPGAEKTIVWAHPDKRKTPLALVYLHGFSASRQETAPLCDQVATRLGANLFYTRLTGHGLDGAALAQASVDDWLGDAEEALQIGRQLGERVVIVGCSTGATLGACLAAKTDNDRVQAYVLISPNFEPHDHTSRVLLWPWANHWAPWLVGAERHSPAKNERHGRYWTTTYPTGALLPMMGVCRIAQQLDLSTVHRPLLMIYSPTDQVVDVAAAQTAFQRWGATEKRAVPFTPTDSNETHVIAGDIRAPSGTRPVADLMVEFLQGLH